ncbi:hypothetical protein GWO43_30750, partial [candidate division KSB1 bacterium]|nr:hypothetical protein [candidate division KSB1 bacterium]NIR68349.1 hypothetical protein [candidate division KSB1 bacterium]NIS28289.1 hypothetical protein [candidate division KSB1 bacterium]NIT75161.1 hypothetical protein [candidate division KSB1 bacterium]NIU28965.1 hypothetical protein [candidate division KSB1 bacterium]
NLFLNAIQGIKETGSITVRTFQKDGKICVKIQDSGEGISTENLDKIFNPGFTTRGVGVGAGLGLPIAYQIVKEHGGDISVETELGKGSEFTVELNTKRNQKPGT